MRPNIDTHDYDVKMRSIRRFFEEGDKVKVNLALPRREMAHTELGVELLNRVKSDTGEIAKVESGAAPRRPPDGDGARPALTLISPRLHSRRDAPINRRSLNKPPQGMPWRLSMLTVKEG